MMGGGFGGCTINLIESDAIEAFIEEVTKEYFFKFNLKPDLITVVPDGGTIVSSFNN